MTVINSLVSNLTQTMGNPGGHDTEGGQDPKMIIVSVGILLLILSVIAYATLKGNATERSCCDRFLNFFPCGSNEEDTVTPPLSLAI